MSLQIINPLEYSGWDELLLTSEKTSFFHTAAWAKVLVESYKYRPFYFTDISEGYISTLFPVMEVRSSLTGKRGVSLPFSDYCEPVTADEQIYMGSLEQVKAFGKKQGWRYLDMRGGKKFLGDITPSLTHYSHMLPLKDDIDETYSTFKSSTKRNIKKAIKEGVSIRISNSPESIKAFFKLNCMTRKRHGLPPQPWRFFKKIYENIIIIKKGTIVIAEYKGQIIAGAVFFHFGKSALYKYGASDMACSHLRPNNLVMWEAIKWHIKNNFSTFDFGITETSNEGLLQFKRGWGVQGKKINYYKYDFKERAFIKDAFREKTSYSFFQKMPQPLLNLTGRLVYRHFG